MEEKGIPKCEKTLTGEHLWEPLARAEQPKYGKFLICIACGMVDNRVVDKVN